MVWGNARGEGRSDGILREDGSEGGRRGRENTRTVCTLPTTPSKWKQHGTHPLMYTHILKMLALPLLI